MIKLTLILSCIFLNFNLIAAADDSLKVLQLHERKFEYMIAVDLEALSEMLHPELLYIHSNGWIETKEEVLENLQSGHLAYHQLTYKTSEVRFFGSTAIVTGLARFDVALAGNPISLDLLYSETWYKTSDVWLLVHRHACRPTVLE